MEEGAWQMLAEIRVTGKVDQAELIKICEKIEKIKSMPDGTRELVWEIERQLRARSYCNNRLMWLAWKLEEAGIRVKWREC